MVEPGESSNEALDPPAKFVLITPERSRQVDAPSAADRAPPRLAIAHLLLWTGCCAVFLGLARGMAEQPTGTLGALFLTLVAAGDGAAWAGLIITLARLWRGARWSIEPGQWLLTLLGVVVAVDVLTELASPRWLRNPQAVVEAAAACAFVVPLFSKRLVPRWKWLFGMVSLLHAWPLLTSLFRWQGHLAEVMVFAATQLTPPWLMAATAVAALGLALFDRSWRERGWLHWTGIATVIWLAVLPFVAPWLLAG